MLPIYIEKKSVSEIFFRPMEAGNLNQMIYIFTYSGGDHLVNVFHKLLNEFKKNLTKYIRNLAKQPL